MFSWRRQESDQGLDYVQMIEMIEKLEKGGSVGPAFNLYSYPAKEIGISEILWRLIRENNKVLDSRLLSSYIEKAGLKRVEGGYFLLKDVGIGYCSEAEARFRDMLKWVQNGSVVEFKNWTEALMHVVYDNSNERKPVLVGKGSIGMVPSYINVQPIVVGGWRFPIGSLFEVKLNLLGKDGNGVFGLMSGNNLVGCGVGDWAVSEVAPLRLTSFVFNDVRTLRGLLEEAEKMCFINLNNCRG